MQKYINLRGAPCPINFVKCQLALEKLDDNQTLQVDLDRGEPEEMVIPGLKEQGYIIQIVFFKSNWLRFIVYCNGSK